MQDIIITDKEPVQESNISLKDFILKIRSLIAYLKSKWLTIFIIACIGGVLGLAYSFIKKPVYVAESTFVLEDGVKGGGLSQYAGLASLAGIDIGGSSGGGIFEGDNILELYKSRLMIEKTLLSEVDLDGKRQLLINRYIDYNHLRDNWKDKQLSSISFNDDPEKFNRKQDSIITDLVKTVNKSLLSVTKPDKKLNIIKVTVSSKDELFAKAFNTKLVETVNNFYTQTKTKKSVQNIQILQKQADSVRSVLNSSISGVASAIDAAPNANPAMLSLRVPSQKKQIDVQASGAIYSEIVKNLEIAKISLRQETPLIQVIDEPVLPLAVNKLGKLKGLVAGFFLGGILIVIWFVVKRIFNTIMS
ncbi:Wzz/FepE/Etk N-terminal domain-containing protein [Mucilaginibacter segetis]|uniref:Lipopolysaccharide biosynthesis protein n=1 Tax=Mucilaginibacter segetis TaxID=2793071 RepID=A0A934PY01_9SPHI|nr:Wzz/FepE/Etk N-terminal domain-containing protein [Mucilaginibacter segetis]MBK0381131.1 lipopolysaccharide biosynthesis protein [Mucilaginibacter segetis]